MGFARQENYIKFCLPVWR